jgi:hypothetical protein
MATGARVGVIINDSHWRTFRNGTVGVAIGAAGVTALQDLRGMPDLYQRPLQSTEVGFADEIASAASLLMGQADEGRPIVLARGILNPTGGGCAAELVRSKELDFFRSVSCADILQAITERRSIGRSTSTPVADTIIDQILQAAVSAPSAHNRQPWRFVVLKSARSKELLAEAMAQRLHEDRRRDGDALDLIEADVSRSIARITGAPIVVTICLTMEGMDSSRRKACGGRASDDRTKHCDGYAEYSAFDTWSSRAGRQYHVCSFVLSGHGAGYARTSYAPGASSADHVGFSRQRRQTVPPSASTRRRAYFGRLTCFLRSRAVSAGRSQDHDRECRHSITWTNTTE